jgi:hypothetical protein
LALQKLPRAIEDWSVLKYGWLAVFGAHLTFLFLGMQFIKDAMRLDHPSLLDPAERRITLVIEALYAITIAFSILLLILAVFVLEILRLQRRVVELLAADGRFSRASPVPPPSAMAAASAPPAAGAGPG